MKVSASFVQHFAIGLNVRRARYKLNNQFCSTITLARSLIRKNVTTSNL